jgi:hypothetical protein
VLSYVARVFMVTVVSLLLYATMVPEVGWAACRPDKCSPTGALLAGYFPQENMVGMYLATLLPTLAYLRRTWWRRISLILVLSCLVMTGSRTSLAAAALALLGYVFLRRRADPQRQHGDAAKLLGLVPLGGFFLSLALIFVLPDQGFTGRGYIFAIVLRAWENAPLLGPGRGILRVAYETSSSIWLSPHEHGQAAYIMAESGLLGLVIFSVALLGIAGACLRSGGPLPAVFALAPTVAFLTEPVWEFSLLALCFVTLLLTAALGGQARRGEPMPLPLPDVSSKA